MSAGSGPDDEVATASGEAGRPGEGTGAGPTDPPEAAPTLPIVSTTRLYSYLVTRHTGRAVRLGIERRLAEVGQEVLAVLDFQDVPVIDFSCADEIVVKLVRGTGRGPCAPSAGGRTGAPVEGPAGVRIDDPAAGRAATGGCALRAFLIRGLAEHHRDPIESALERQSAAVAAEDGAGRALVLGSVAADAVRTWHDVREAGRTGAGAVASRLRMGEAEARRTLEALAERRLVLRDGDGYVSLWRVLARAREARAGR